MGPETGKVKDSKEHYLLESKGIDFPTRLEA